MNQRSKKPWHDFTHMAFDIDGTLLNSNIAHVWAWQDAMEAEALFFPHLTLFSQMGLPGDHIIKKFSYLFTDEEQGKRIAKAAGEIYTEKYVHLIAPYSGAIDLLQKLSHQKKKIYALTSASKTEMDSMVKRFHLEKYFDQILTKEDLGEGKPSAEPFLKLKQRIGAKADLVSFGDSPYDLQASYSAGVPFVHLGHGGYPREWFSKAMAQFFNINELLQNLDKTVFSELKLQ